MIDRSLDPGENPSMQGRYRFGVGHEIGHWRLHRVYVASDPDQAALFDTSGAEEQLDRSVALLC